jgi:hypothetical protein
MFTGNTLSVPAVPGAFMFPDNLTPSTQFSYQLGGIGIGNASQGLQYQVWYLQIGGTSQAILSAPNTPPIVLFTVTNLTSVSLAFDSNMNPAVAYVSQGNAYLWWFDATIPGFTIVTLPAGATDPQATLDDKRAFSLQAGLSDIIVSYINTNDLFFRMQRDRFTIEYSLYTGISPTVVPVNPQLLKIGMNVDYRMQWMFSGAYYGYLYAG